MPQQKATGMRRGRGFKRADSFLQTRIREASASRIARPVEVSYGRGGMGATLVLLTTGAHAPMLEMEKEKLRARVNGVYGYNAISRVRITQTAPTGFSEGRVGRTGPGNSPSCCRQSCADCG